MADWYDRLISWLGLDSSRLDRIVGVTVAEFGDHPPVSARTNGPVRLVLARTTNGQFQWVFEWADHGPALALIPVTSANLQHFRQWCSTLQRARESASPNNGSPTQIRHTRESEQPPSPFPDESPHMRVLVEVGRHSPGKVFGALIATSGAKSVRATLLVTDDLLVALRRSIAAGEESCEVAR